MFLRERYRDLGKISLVNERRVLCGKTNGGQKRRRHSGGGGAAGVVG